MKINEVIPELLVADIQRSADFYRQILDLQLEVLWEQDGNAQFARLWHDSHNIFLNRQPDRGDLASGISPAKLWFAINGIESLHQRLRSEGLGVGEIVNTEYGTKEFLIKDPDGYQVGVQERDGDWKF